MEVTTKPIEGLERFSVVDIWDNPDMVDIFNEISFFDLSNDIKKILGKEVGVALSSSPGSLGVNGGTQISKRETRIVIGEIDPNVWEEFGDRVREILPLEVEKVQVFDGIIRNFDYKTKGGKGEMAELN